MAVTRLWPAAASVLSVVVGWLVFAGPAPAAFPGHNGAIAWEGSTNDRPSAVAELGLFHADGGTSALPTGTCEENPTVGYSNCPTYAGLSFSPDGTRVAVEQIDTPPEAAVASSRLAIASGGAAPTPLPALTSGDADPAWSGHGTRLVFSGDLSARGEGLGRIYTVAADGSGLRRLTSARDSRDPRWSANSRYIAYLRYVGERADLWIMRADGSGARRLYRDVGNPVFPSLSSAPSWSPRSTAIAFAHRGAIYTIGVDGRHLHRVTSAHFFAAASTPAWSPNGVRIAFVGRRQPAASNLAEFWTIDPSGRHPHLFPWIGRSGEDDTLLGFDWQRLPSP